MYLNIGAQKRAGISLVKIPAPFPRGIKEKTLFDSCKKRNGSWHVDFIEETRIREKMEIPGLDGILTAGNRNCFSSGI